MSRRSIRSLLAVGGAAVAISATVLIATPALAATTATVVKTSSWGSGFEGKATISNSGPGAITSWTLAFDLPAGTSISSSWDSVRTGSAGHVTFTNLGWNGNVPVGGSVSFGFIGAGSGDPTNCTINGAACGTGAPPVNDNQPPTVPQGLRGTAASNSEINLNWNASSDNVGVTGYDVERDGAVVGNATGTSFTDSGLARNSTHRYRVRAKDGRNNLSAFSAQIQVTTRNDNQNPPPGGMGAAPYLFPGFGAPIPDPRTVMNATGIRNFTIAFVLASGCNPVWDGEGGLTGGQHQASINAIRAAGGDIIPSFGGFNGSKLGEQCGTPQALAAAYMRVVTQFNLRAIDIDIEANEFDNDASRNRVVDALKIVKQQRPSLITIVTIPILQSGPNFAGNQLILRAAQVQANIDIFTIMPFDFGVGGGDMFAATVSAVNGTRNAIRTAFGISDAAALQRMGISGMNGLSDQSELTSLQTWTRIRDFANQNNLARLAFWGVNRDRGCPGQAVNSSCSSIAQGDWDFTRVNAGFRR